jgi:hypothetical protein
MPGTKSGAPAPLLSWQTKGALQVGELWIDFAAGVGLDGAGQGTDPTVMVRAAPEGVSFGVERTENLGAIGEYDTQVRFFDFGTGRKWVFEVSTSDPVFSGMKGRWRKSR